MTGLRRYLEHFRGDGPGIAASAGLMAVAAAIPGAAVLLLQRALDHGLSPDGARWLPVYALGFAGLYALAGVLRLLRTRVTKGIAWRVAARVRTRLHAHWLRLGGGSTGERLARLTGEVDDLQYGVSALVTAFRNPLTVAVLATAAVAVAPRLAPWALLVLPALWLAGRWSGARVRRRAARSRDARAALSDLAQQQLAGQATVRDFAAEDAESARFAALAEADRRARLALDVERVLPSAVVHGIAAAGLGALLWIGGRQVAGGALEPGALIAFAAALALMNRPIAGLSEVWALLQRSLAALERVHAALDAVPPVSSPRDPTALPAPPWALEWDAVTVDFGNGPVLEGATLRIRPGEVVALVGPTGAGKSTLLHLLGRQRDPDAGVVRVGGADVRDLDLGELRRGLATVRQEGVLFARTIAENLALGAPGATRAAMEDAARRAGADAFIAALPRGYDTPLDELGRRLSGGERQRLCLARALLAGAPVLLLDEATNQVDAATEQAVLEAVRAAAGAITVVLAAHDLGAARAADRIAVVAGGRIAEVGTHPELIARDARYAALWRAWRGTEVA